MGLPTNKEKEGSPEKDTFFDGVPEGYDQIETNLKYHDFDKAPIIKGSFLRLHYANNEVAGYVFDDENGNDLLVGASYNIVNAMSKAKEGDFYMIQFLGKEKIAGGKSVNKFNVYKRK